MKQIILSFILIIYSINTFPQYINYNLTNQSETLSSSNNELNLSKMTDTSAFYKSEIGFTAGFNRCIFYNFCEDCEGCDDEDYKPYINYSFSFFYKEKTGDKTYVGIELENAAFKIKAKTFSFDLMYYYKQNVEYYINDIKIFFLFGSKIIDAKNIDLNFDIGPCVSYQLYSKAKGNAEKEIWVQHQDTAGNIIMVPELRRYSFVESPTKDFEKFNIGMRLDYNIEIFLNERLSLMFVNNYFLGILETFNLCNKKLWDITFSLGVIYKFNKTYQKKLSLNNKVFRT